MKRKLIAGVVLAAAASVAWFVFFNHSKPSAEQSATPDQAALVKTEAPINTNEATQTKPVASAETTVSSDPETQKIVAEFSNGEKINLKQVKDTFATLPPQLQEVGLEKIYEPLLGRLIDTKLLLNAAQQAGIDQNADVLKRIAEAQEALIQKAYLDKEISKLITDTILQDKYQELLKLLPKDQIEVKLSHILVKTKQEAEEILKQIKSGKSFDELVTEKSIDTESKQKGGDLGYIRKDDLPKEFTDPVFKAAKGSIVTEALKIGEVGYSVIRVDDKRPVEPPKFEKVRDDIYKAVSPEYAVKVIEKLRQDSGVKKFGLDGKPLVEKTPEQKKAQADAEAKGEKQPEQPAVDLKSLDDQMVVGEFSNGEKITIAQLKESIATLPAQLKEIPFDKVFEPLLNRVIDMKLISAEARKAGMDKDPTVLKRIADAKEALIQKFYLEQEVAKLITPDMISAKYQQLLKMMPKNEMEIRLRHILVKTKEEADKILKAIKGGANFEEMVKTMSIDEQSKPNGGDLGYVRRADLPKEFGDSVFKAPKATLLPEPIHVGDMGYSVVRVEDKRPIEPPKMEEVKGELLKVLSAEQSVKVLEKLRQNITVKKFDMNGQPLPDKPAEPKKAEPTQPPVEASDANKANELSKKTETENPKKVPTA